jgi:AcrR family transcriptional regulator
VNRRRSLSSQENDERLLEAALDEIVAVGVDGLGMSGVARRAGLTTGALYGRYENVNELAAAVWTARVRDAHFAFLDAAVRALVDRDGSIAVAEFVGELTCPSRSTIAALDLLATAHRIDELDEVVTPDVDAWLKGWGAAPRGRPRLRRAQVLFTIGSLWGVLLHAIPRARPAHWEQVFTDVGRSYVREQEAFPTRFVPEPAGSVRANVGDPSQDALIDSVLAITARVGFERATASRISRRANLTSGAIYTRYQTKDELLAHAIEVLLAQRFADDLEANTYLFTAPDVGAATARVVGGYLSPARRDWRIFRVEAQIAARHHPPIAAILDRVQEDAIRAYLDALGARNDEERLLLDGVARFAQLVPLGLAFADLVAPGIPGTDGRHVLVPLLTAPVP